MISDVGIVGSSWEPPVQRGKVRLLALQITGDIRFGGLVMRDMTPAMLVGGCPSAAHH
jgi:hypothetical protein